MVMLKKLFYISLGLIFIVNAFLFAGIDVNYSIPIKQGHLSSNLPPKSTEVTKGFNWQKIQDSKHAVVQIFSSVCEFNWVKPCQLPEERYGAGSGFIVDTRGFIVTNYHVVENAVVIFIQIAGDKNRFEVEKVGSYPEKDVAVLKVKDNVYQKFLDTFKTLGHPDVPTLELGSSDNLISSQKIAVAGFPLGQENLKITTGNYSGPQFIGGRTLMQTDAAVNPGNSGGPCFDASGKVTGIVVSGFTGAQNVGYFIPISDVKKVINGFIDGKYSSKILKSIFWGVTAHPITEDTLSIFQIPQICGVRVCKIAKNSLFEKYGVKVEDIICSIDGLDIDRYGYIKVDWCQDKVNFNDVLARYDFDSKFNLRLYRKIENGEVREINLEVKVEFLPDLAICEKFPEIDKIDYEIFAGIIFMELSLNHIEILQEGIAIALKEYGRLMLPPVLKYQEDEKRLESRVVITHIYSGSYAYNSRCLKLGDVLKTVNGVDVKTLKDLRDAVKLSKESGYLTLETDDGIRYDESLKKILYQEDFLIDYYHYNKSNIFNELTGGAINQKA